MQKSKTYWVVKNAFMAGALPAINDNSGVIKIDPFIVKHNFDVFINLMEENERDHDGNLLPDYSKLLPDHILFIRLPIRDMDIPSPMEAWRLVDLLGVFLAHDKKVYIHCWDGLGRTGTLVGCYLLQNGMAERKNVMRRIKGLKSGSGLEEYDSPQTKEQKQFVLTWQTK